MPDLRAAKLRVLALAVGMAFADRASRIDMDDDGAATTKRHRGWSPWYWLFVVEFVLALWPPFFNRVEPTWIGIPFFYWYQLLAVLICAVLTAIVYFATDDA